MLFLALKKGLGAPNHSQSHSHDLVKSHPWQNFPLSLLGKSPYLLMLFGKPCLSVHEKLDSLKVITLTVVIDIVHFSSLNSNFKSS